MSTANVLNPSTAQRGFSLVVVMIIMVVVSLLGVAASQMVLLGERSARYDRDWQIAYQAAEAALLDAEFDIRGSTTVSGSRMAKFSNTSREGFIEGCGTSGPPDNTRGLCRSHAAGIKPIFYTVDFTDTSPTAPTVGFGEFTGRQLANSTGAFNAGAQPYALPRYIIEDVPDQPPGSSAATKKVMYRITAVGFGPRPETRAVLQMFFRKE